MRSDHCAEVDGLCESAKTNGASLVHGSRQIFHNTMQREFKALYSVLRDVSQSSKIIYATQNNQGRIQGSHWASPQYTILIVHGRHKKSSVVELQS